MDFKKLEQFLESVGPEFGVPGCDCVIYQKHKPVFRHMSGYFDSAKTRPVSDRDLYWIYSASKVITCTAAMQLVEKGLIKLDDPVGKYLPEYSKMMVDDCGELRPAKNAMTIEDLFTMSGGLTYNIKTPAIEKVKAATNNRASTREIIAALAESPLVFEPGEGYLYSMCHDVLAAVIEVATGLKFSDYLSANIFEPLGMKDICFKTTPENTDRISSQYRYDIDTDTVNEINELPFTDISGNYESGGGGFLCPVNDYILFADAMCNNGEAYNGYRLLSKESIDNMRTNRLSGFRLSEFEKMGKIGYGYGLGVRTMIDNSKAKSPIGEFGWDGAAGAYVMLDPINNIAVFYAQHVLEYKKVFNVIHPTIRDLTYEGFGI